MGYTWCDANDEPKSRIDYVSINKTFHYEVRNIVVRKIPGTHSNGSRMSDHRFLNFTFNISKTNKGLGYWNLFTFFLDDNKYNEGIVNIAKNINENLPRIARWEYFKHKVNEFSIESTKRNQNIIKNRIHYIEKEID